jgi:hypothetical protein
MQHVCFCTGFITYQNNYSRIIGFVNYVAMSEIGDSQENCIWKLTLMLILLLLSKWLSIHQDCVTNSIPRFVMSILMSIALRLFSIDAFLHVKSTELCNGSVGLAKCILML